MRVLILDAAGSILRSCTVADEAAGLQQLGSDGVTVVVIDPETDTGTQIDDAVVKVDLTSGALVDVTTGAPPSGDMDGLGEFLLLDIAV